jgi:4-amino-4-deoxy-L-arabinose transferase-like glycosyltransferase
VIHLTQLNSRRTQLVLLAVVCCVGIFLRLPPLLFAGPHAPLSAFRTLHPVPLWNEQGRRGVDEELYREYVNELTAKGVGRYPEIILHYIEVQNDLRGSILPPMRFLYIFTSYIWRLLFGTEALAALTAVASTFSILTLLLSAVAAWRWKGLGPGIGITALMAVAPTQIHMSQHALVDGFFAFFALATLWLLWENLRRPRDWRWLAPYVLGITCMVLTKENSFFAFIGLLALLAANRWLRFGTVTRELLVATALGPLLGVAILTLLAGGLDVLIGTYRLSVTKNYQLEYAILTGDGPWYRYIVDLVLVSPVVTLLAISALFRRRREPSPELFVIIFIVTTYLVMCNVKYGMNLRYTNMWDMPLRMLAFTQIAAVGRRFTRYVDLATVVAVVAVCAIELRQYYVLFIWFPGYELITPNLLQALRMLKFPLAR